MAPVLETMFNIIAFWLSLGIEITTQINSSKQYSPIWVLTYQKYDVICLQVDQSSPLQANEQCIWAEMPLLSKF